jgi:RNA polymerase sigma factor (sigma-70 family)
MRRTERNEYVRRSAFEAFFRDHYIRLHNFVSLRVSSDNVDETVSSTFIVAWRKFSTAKEPNLPWLFQIASYEIKNHYRVHGRAPYVVSLDTPDEFEARDIPDFDGAYVRSALATLSSSDQELVQLIHWDELTREEAARFLGVSVNALNVRYFRALSRLEQLIGPRTDVPTNKEPKNG